MAYTSYKRYRRDLAAGKLKYRRPLSKREVTYRGKHTVVSQKIPEKYSIAEWYRPPTSASPGITRRDYEGMQAKIVFASYVPPSAYKQAAKAAGLKARGFAGEMTTQYSIHRGMPQVLADLLEESKEPGAPSGISIGKVVGVSVVGYGLWVLLS